MSELSTYQINHLAQLQNASERLETAKKEYKAALEHWRNAKSLAQKAVPSIFKHHIDDADDE